MYVFIFITGLSAFFQNLDPINRKYEPSELFATVLYAAGFAEGLGSSRMLPVHGVGLVGAAGHAE